MPWLIRTIWKSIRKRQYTRAECSAILIFGWFMVVLAVGVFLKVVGEVFLENGPVDADTCIITTLRKLMFPTLTSFMIAVTRMGSLVAVLLLGGMVTAWFAMVKKPSNSLMTLYVTCGSGGLNLALKNILQRPRPSLFPPLVAEHGYSFPSGHSMLSMSFYGLLIYFVVKSTLPIFSKLISISALMLLIILIGISRIYLGVHYPTDVLGGFIAGGAWLLTCILIAEGAKLETI